MTKKCYCRGDFKYKLKIIPKKVFINLFLYIGVCSCGNECMAGGVCKCQDDCKCKKECHGK